MSTQPNSIAYKLKQIRNRFYDIGDDYGVTMCHNLAEDLEVDIGSGGLPDDEEQED